MLSGGRDRPRTDTLPRSAGDCGEVKPHRLLNMPEPVTTQVLAAIPACHDDQMLAEFCPLQHPQDDHARPAFTVVVLERASAVRSPHVLWVALANFRLRFSSVSRACASAAE